MSLHIGSVGRGAGRQDGDGGTGGGRAAKAARDVMGFLERGGSNKTGHSADCVLITVVGLPRSSGGARNRQAKKARKSATILTMSTHCWSLTHL